MKSFLARGMAALVMLSSSVLCAQRVSVNEPTYLPEAYQGYPTTDPSSHTFSRRAPASYTFMSSRQPARSTPSPSDANVAEQMPAPPAAGPYLGGELMMGPGQYGWGLGRGAWGGHKVAADGCGALGACGAGCGPALFGSVGGLVMTRDRGDHVCFSFNTATPSVILLGTPDAEMPWAGGAEARIGRYFGGACGKNPCGGRWGTELVYWGVYPNPQEGNAFDPDGTQGSGTDLNSAFAFQSLDYNGGPILPLFDDAVRHQLQRSYEYHNFEWNIFGTPCPSLRCGKGLQLTWIGGFRFFKLSDAFAYNSDDADTVFTGTVDEATYSVDVQNHLLGFQLGNQLDYYCGKRFNLFARAKVGAFYNHITHRSFVGGTLGAAVINDPANFYDGRSFDINSYKNDMSFLAELDLGMNFQVTCCLSTQVGYRAVGLTGVALAPEQIPLNFGDYEGVRFVDSGGSMILHGGYAGLTFTW